MHGGSDASAMEALIQVTLMAERAWENATLSGGWQSTLDYVVVKPSLHGVDREKDGRSSWRRTTLHRRERFYSTIRTAIINPGTLSKPRLRLLLSSWTTFILLKELKVYRTSPWSVGGTFWK